MRKILPYNNILKDYKGLLKDFIGQIYGAEQGNAISIFVTGSFARGEATEASDLDIWCIFDVVSTETLNRVGLASRNLPISYNDLEINAQCLSLSEFNSSHFSKFLAYPIIFAEGVLIHGNDIAARNVQCYEIKKTCNELLAEILMSIRHYIAVNEPAEKLTYAKIKAWVLKPLMFALRLERYSKAGHYPLTTTELFNSYSSPPMSVVYFMDSEKWSEDIQTKRDDVLHLLHEEVANLLAHLKNNQQG
ncbi:MAG: nucleotidyltransferase domain-containing protein [Defluviitaleaceae bacterium]|nr:nucleotidyltransferase domain-containing protein [Defluviitaleaceae bacterium]